jgi:hypothetical protein
VETALRQAGFGILEVTNAVQECSANGGGNGS